MERRWAEKALGAVLLWQAGAAGVQFVTDVSSRASVSWRERLFASDDDRLRHFLGNEFELFCTLRAHAPKDSLLVLRELQGTVADVPRLAAKFWARYGIGHFLYPAPRVVRVVDPIAQIEARAPAGVDVILAVAPDEPAPTAGNSWELVCSEPGAQLWRHRRD